MKLSIIILNYNTKDYTLQAINSIPKHTDWEILVVDNASTDDSVAAFEEWGSQIVLIKNKGPVIKQGLMSSCVYDERWITDWK